MYKEDPFEGNELEADSNCNSTVCSRCGAVKQDQKAFWKHQHSGYKCNTFGKLFECKECLNFKREQLPNFVRWRRFVCSGFFTIIYFFIVATYNCYSFERHYWSQNCLNNLHYGELLVYPYCKWTEPHWMILERLFHYSQRGAEQKESWWGTGRPHW